MTTSTWVSLVPLHKPCRALCRLLSSADCHTNPLGGLACHCAVAAAAAGAGTWRRLGTGNQCQAADNDDDAKARVFAGRYFCACLPRKVRRRQRRLSWPSPLQPSRGHAVQLSRVL